MNRWIFLGFILVLATVGGEVCLAFPLIFYLALFRPLDVPPFSLVVLGIGTDALLGKEIWGITSIDFLLLYIFAMKPRILLSQLPFYLLWIYFGLILFLTWSFESILSGIRVFPLPSPIPWFFSMSLYPLMSWGADRFLRKKEEVLP